jgi:Spy/CpxP family protein refolding chaperone
MKKLIMFAVATVMAMNVAQAADDDKKKAPRKGRAGGIQAMIKQLDLTADQKKALAKFNKENKEKGAEARKLEGKERRAAMKKIAEARNAKLKEILTEEQAKKLKELQAKQAKARADRKGKKKKSEDK